ncbi:hypothetical protein ACFQ4C_22110 [Larkinella insperata]|uniref:Uncharacterized protein n=1 Tax=Larkinella insperata TaxID=332158 RepID=A0ABW3QNN1_9BACT|nr:hypothetical protein [Larkinella insperata]
MKALWTVPEKLIVRQFYLQNSGLFLVVLLLGFGFLSSNEHIALATYALHDSVFLAGYVALWLLYTAYVIHFQRQLLHTTNLLQFFRLIPAVKRLSVFYLLNLQLLAPVVLYAGFMLWVGVQQRTTTANGSLILIAGTLSLLPLPFIERALHNPNPELFTGYLGNWLRQTLTTPYGLFFIRYLFREQPITLLLTKAGSCLLTAGILLLYPTDDYDIRLLSLGMLLSAAFHAGVVFELYQFEARQLMLLRNLPLPLARRLLLYGGIQALLLIPEALLLIVRGPETVSLLDLAGVWFLGFSLLWLQFAALLTRHQPRDRFVATLFWPLIAFFLLIMYRLPAGSLASLSIVVATSLFIRNFYRSTWEENDL